VQLEKLPVVTDRQRHVPQLLAEIRKCIDEQDGLACEGIFRQCADQKVQAFVRGRLERGEPPETVLAGCTPDVLASLLKEWYRELPGGIWLNAGEAEQHKGKRGNSNKDASNSGISIAELEHAMLSAKSAPMTMLLKQAMRPAQRETFLWLLDLLVETASFEESSRMGVRGLAVVFAPVLIPPSISLPADEQMRRAKDSAALCERLILFHRTQGSEGGRKGVPPRPPMLRNSSSGSKRKLLDTDSSSSTGLTSHCEEVHLSPSKRVWNVSRIDEDESSSEATRASGVS